MSPCAARSSRATMSIAPTWPPCALNSTSFFTPARATPAPISFHMRMSVSADSVSVPAKRACSGLRPICCVGRNSTGSPAGSSGKDAATMPSASTVSTPSGRCGPCCSVAPSGSTATVEAASSPAKSRVVSWDQ